MANGLLGKAALAATTYTQIYQTTSGKSATANIRLVNRDQINAVTVRLAICPSSWISGAPANADYIEPPDLVIPACGFLEDTGMAMSSLEQVVAYASAATVTIRVHGFEA